MLEKYNRLNSKKYITFAALSSVLISGACAVLGSPQWMVNDDALMQSLASGQYTGSPESVLVFVSRILGWIISAGYSLIPGVQWYAVVLFVSLLISVISLASLCRSRFEIVIWCAVSFPALVWISLRPSFTTVAVIAVASGSVVFVSAVIGRIGKYGFYLGGFLIILGVLWRSDLGLFALVVMTPLAVTLAVMNRDRFVIRTRRIVLFVVTILVIIVVFVGINHSCLFLSQCSDWQSYFQWNTFRGAFNEDPRSYALPQFIGSWGWSPASLGLFLSYAYPDSSIFGLDALRSAYESVPGLLRMNGPSPLDHVTSIIQVLLRFWPYLIVVGSMVVCSLLRSDSKKKVLAPTAVFFAWFFLLVNLIALLRLTEPLIIGLVIELAIGTFAILMLSAEVMISEARNESRSIETLSIFSLVTSMAMLLGLGGQSIFQTISSNSATATVSRVVSERYQAIVGNSRAFSTAYFPNCLQAPFLPAPFEPPTSKVTGPLSSGWLVFSPAFETRKTKLGMGDIYADIWSGARNNFGENGVEFVGTEAQVKNTIQVMNQQLGYSPALNYIKVGELCPSVEQPESEVSVWKFMASN